MIYRVRHLTHYEYDAPVTLCYNLAYMLPRDTKYQKVLKSDLVIKPFSTTGKQRTDFYGNTVYYFTVEEPHKELSIEVISEIQIEDFKFATEHDLNLDFGTTCGEVLRTIQQSTDPEMLKAREFCLNSNMIKTAPALRDYALTSFNSSRPFLSAVRELTHRIFTDFTYDPDSTGIATPLAEVLRKKRGVCQDFAHLAIGCLRSLGFPARYISGYLETMPPPGKEKLVGSDASHAWFAVYSPGEGWFEFDPTNDNMPAEHHITTAWGRDYSDVSPLKGVFFDGGKSHKLKVAVDVNQVDRAAFQAHVQTLLQSQSQSQS